MKKRLYIIIWIYLLYSIVTYHHIKNNPGDNNSRYVFHNGKIVDKIGSILGFEKWKVKWIALPAPFILLRRENHDMNETWIRHEQTHHLQQLESCYLSPIVSRLEYQYAKHTLGKTQMQAYLRKATEQEAYLHQNNPNYNKNRKRRNIRQYFFKKTAFTLKNYHVILPQK